MSTFLSTRVLTLELISVFGYSFSIGLVSGFLISSFLPFSANLVSGFLVSATFVSLVFLTSTSGFLVYANAGLTSDFTSVFFTSSIFLVLFYFEPSTFLVLLASILALVSIILSAFLTTSFVFVSNLFLKLVFN